jgi:hypothetical protein
MMSCTAKHGVTSDDCGPAITSMTGQVHQFLDEGGPVEDDARDLADRYVAIWNEPDAERGRNAVKHAMRHRCAFHLLQPPEEVRQVAAALGVCRPSRPVAIGSCTPESADTYSDPVG